MNIVANQTELLANSSVKSLATNIVKNPGGVVGKILGKSAGFVASAAGGAAMDIASGVEWGGTKVGQGASYLYNQASGFLSGGTNIFSGLSSGLAAGLSSVNPGYGETFKGWEDALSKMSPGTYLGKSGGQLISMVKDAAGAVSASVHLPGSISPGITDNVPEGGLAVVDPSQLVAPSTAGTSYPGQLPPGINPAGINPAGMSFPGGPAGAGMAYDQTSAQMMDEMVQNALNPKPKGGAVDHQEASFSPLMILGLLGVGFAIFKGGVGKGPLTRRRRGRK